MIYVSKINKKQHQCVCNIYDFVFQCSIFIEYFQNIFKVETLINIQFDWKIVNYTAVVIPSIGCYCCNVASTQTIVIDSLQIIFFQIFAFVLSCDVVRVACLSKQASECSFITLTGNFLLHIGENTLQYFFYPYCYVHLSLEHHPTLVSSYQTRIFTTPKPGKWCRG